MSEGSFFWREHMVQTGHFKKEDKAYNYQEIEADDRSYDSYQHCSHVMIYAKTKKKCLHYFNMKAVVLVSFESTFHFQSNQTCLSKPQCVKIFIVY